MKDIPRSRRLRFPRRRHQLTKPITSDNDESDFEQKSVIRTNKNANRIPTITNVSIVEKQQPTLHSSSDQSSLYLQKRTSISDDLTPLTITTTNTTQLTALTFSNTKQTVKIDLTQLSGTDTLDSSSTTSDQDYSLSLNRKNFIHTYDTDTSMKSIVFSKENSFKQELSYQKHASCFIIPGVGNGDSMTIQDRSLSTPIDINLNTCQQSSSSSSVQWNLQHMTNKFKIFIGCSSLGLIAGLVIFLIIL